MSNLDSSQLDFDALYEAVYAFEDAGEEYERIVRRVYETVLVPGDVACDIGAHVGKHTLPLALACGPSGRVLAVEAIPWAHARLAERVRRAGLSDVVHAIHAACADTEGEITFSVIPSHPGWSSIAPRAGVTDIETTTVAQTTIDAQCPADGPAVRFMKVDVEGAELLVLRGAQATLQRSRPVVHIEVVRQALAAFDCTVADVAQPLRELGYRLFDLLGNDVTDPGTWERSATAPALSDYIAIHPEDPSFARVRKVLDASFTPERLDRVVAPAALLPPPIEGNPRPTSTGRFFDGGAPVPEALLRPLGRPAATRWPDPASGGRVLLGLDGSPAVHEPATDQLVDVSSPTRVPLPLAIAPGSLPAGRAVLFDLVVAGLEGGAHQTLVELNWQDSPIVTLCRIHADGRLEVLWLGLGGTKVAGKSVRPSQGWDSVAIEIWNTGSVVHVSARAGKSEAWSTFPLAKLRAPGFDGVIGRRSHHSHPEPLKQSAVELTVLSGRPSAHARAKVRSLRLARLRHPRSVARRLRSRIVGSRAR